MANYHLTSRKRQVIYLSSAGTLSSGDGQDIAVVPFNNCDVVGIYAALDDEGSGTGDTSIQINRVRDGSDAELLSTTINLAPGTYQDDDNANLQNVSLVQGDILRLDIDSIPSNSDSAGCAVAVVVHITGEGQ